MDLLDKKLSALSQSEIYTLRKAPLSSESKQYVSYILNCLICKKLTFFARRRTMRNTLERVGLSSQIQI